MLLAASPIWAGAAAGALLGAIAGSFIATLVIRLPQGRGIGGRSACDNCGRQLSAIELVPMLSYAWLRGQCRSCAHPIHPRHPLIELAAAALGAVAFAFMPGWAGVAGALFAWMLLALAVLDSEHLWLPDMLTLPLLGMGLASAIVVDEPSIGDRLIGAAAAYCVLGLIAWTYKRMRGRDGLGGGDPKLFAAIGAWLGWEPLPVVLLGASLIGFASIGVAMLRGKSFGADTRVPLGTMLAIAAWPVWLATTVGA
jgi:leader peptidase (prepilin peptidase)/N-methyltransferase